MFTPIFERKEAERIEEENRIAEAKRIEDEKRAAFEKEQEIFRKQQEEFKRQQEELQKQKEEAAAQKLKDLEEAKKAKIKERLSQLSDVMYDGAHAWCLLFEENIPAVSKNSIEDWIS